MGDVRFVVVNSHLEHSRTLLPELERRVSFKVYQDEDTVDVWGQMKGKKDDVYIYDKCGLLAYYIPFPLSIMTSGENLVRTALLAAYHRSPCAHRCESDPNNEYETDPFEEFSPSNATEHVNITQTENNISQNSKEFHNDTMEHSTSSKDYDYAVYNETLEEYDSNESTSKNNSQIPNGIIWFSSNNNTTYQDDAQASNSLDGLIFNINSTSEDNTIFNDTEMVLQESINSTESNNLIWNRNDNLQFNGSFRTSINGTIAINTTEVMEEYGTTQVTNLNSTTTTKPKPKSDRCAEADLSVCKNWSKNKLLRAQECCSAPDARGRNAQHCRSFSQKRCKKIKTILKCCIKTTLTEATITRVPEEHLCCKNSTEGRNCRLTRNSTCEPEEFIVTERQKDKDKQKTEKVQTITELSGEKTTRPSTPVSATESDNIKADDQGESPPTSMRLEGVM